MDALILNTSNSKHTFQFPIAAVREDDLILIHEYSTCRRSMDYQLT